jgi:hypothetical protein
MGWQIYALDHREFFGAMSWWDTGLGPAGEKYYPGSLSVEVENGHGTMPPALVAVTGEGYLTRGVLGCPSDDGTDGAMTSTAESEGYGTGFLEFKNGLMAGWINEYFGYNLQTPNPDRDGFYRWNTDLYNGDEPYSRQSMAQILPFSYATNSHCSAWNNDHHASCPLRWSGNFIRRSNDSGAFYMATDIGNLVNPGGANDGDGTFALHVSGCDDPNSRWSTGGRHAGGGRNWISLDGHAQYIEPLSDYAEANGTATNEQVREHYFMLGLQVFAGGYREDIEPVFDLSTYMENRAAERYQRFQWASRDYSSSYPPSGTHWSTCYTTYKTSTFGTRHVCGGLNWDNAEGTGGMDF